MPSSTKIQYTRENPIYGIVDIVDRETVFTSLAVCYENPMREMACIDAGGSVLSEGWRWTGVATNA